MPMERITATAYAALAALVVGAVITGLITGSLPLAVAAFGYGIVILLTTTGLAYAWLAHSEEIRDY